MKKPETKFKEHVQKRLKTLHRTWFFKVDLLSILGIPDIIGCCAGKFFAWELKVGDNEPSELQKFVLRKIRNAGGVAREVTPETFDAAFRQLESWSHSQGKPRYPKKSERF